MLYVALRWTWWSGLAGQDGLSEQDTGVPLKAEIAGGAESRRNWKPTLNEREGQRLVLQKVIEAIVE